MTTAQRIARLQRELYPDLAALEKEMRQEVPASEPIEYTNGLAWTRGSVRGFSPEREAQIARLIGSLNSLRPWSHKLERTLMATEDVRQILHDAIRETGASQVGYFDIDGRKVTCLQAMVRLWPEKYQDRA